VTVIEFNNKIFSYFFFILVFIFALAVLFAF